MARKQRDLSRRDFIKTSAAGLAGAAALTGGLGPFIGKASAAVAPLELAVEKEPVLRVLRWSPFVKADGDWWEKNSRAWEQVTGGKVINEYLSWEDVRPKAAMEASVGAGHDLVLGWHDDPHIYPDKLVDVTDVCEYLGAKYGGWEPVCMKYGMKDGRWIAVPMGGPGQEMVYRKSYVNEAGFDEFPKDVDNFIKLSKKLKTMGHPVGFALGHAVGDGNNWVHTWLWAYGGKTVNADGSVAINSNETRGAMEGMKELFMDGMISGCASWLDPHNNKAYLADQVSVTNNGISIYYAAKDKFPEIAEDTYHANLPVGTVRKADRTPSFRSDLHLQAQQVPQCGQALHYVHAGRGAVRALDQRHARVRHSGSDLLPGSARLDGRPQAHPVSRLHPEHAVERI